jgi:hypothetical protein
LFRRGFRCRFDQNGPWWRNIDARAVVSPEAHNGGERTTITRELAYCEKSQAAKSTQFDEMLRFLAGAKNAYGDRTAQAA